MIENFSLYHTVCENRDALSPIKYFVKSTLCSKVAFTNFFSKRYEEESPQFPHCLQKGKNLLNQVEQISCSREKRIKIFAPLMQKKVETVKFYNLKSVVYSTNYSHTKAGEVGSEYSKDQR